MVEYPDRLELDSAGGRTAYVLRRDLHAIHDWNGADADRAVHALPAARVAAFRGDEPTAEGGRRHTEAHLPVYESVPGAQLVYPTGAVWVRFAAGIDARSRAADLARAGFRIERSPGYAPNGAFVRASDAAHALSQLDALRSVEGVELVEPQMLREASSR